MPSACSEPTGPVTGPREQLQLRGAHSLSDAQLLAVVLGSGSSGAPVAVLAERLLQRAGGLRELARLGAAGLASEPGLGPSKACRLEAAFELGIRLSSRPLLRGRPLGSSRDVIAAVAPRLRAAEQESFIAVALDAKNRPLSELEIARGGLSACAVQPADVFRQVLRVPAASVIFVHNHPSGEPLPSDEDVAFTRRLVTAGELLGLQVLDHLIIGARDEFSFLDAGLLYR